MYPFIYTTTSSLCCAANARNLQVDPPCSRASNCCTAHEAWMESKNVCPKRALEIYMQAMQNTRVCPQAMQRKTNERKEHERLIRVPEAENKQAHKGAGCEECTRARAHLLTPLSLFFWRKHHRQSRANIPLSHKKKKKKRKQHILIQHVEPLNWFSCLYRVQSPGFRYHCYRFRCHDYRPAGKKSETGAC